MNKFEELFTQEDLFEPEYLEQDSAIPEENDNSEMLVALKRALLEYVQSQGLPLCEGITEYNLETFLKINV